MDLTRLTSAIVRQTTVLVARLSTLGGVRSPLARVADEVFLGLVSELERQGVGKKVAADMFGLALRSYQLKVQRLQESASDRGVTLWAAIRSYIEESGSVSRGAILHRFGRDDPASVRGILNDLVESGLTYRTGRGDQSLYRNTPREDMGQLGTGNSGQAEAALVGLLVCQNGPLSFSEVEAACGLSSDATLRALDSLIAEGSIQRVQIGGETRFQSERCLIPIGDEAGWEAAVIDHHQTVLNAIAAKIQSGTTRSAPSDQTGGSTYAFELWSGHPEEEVVRGQLSRIRSEVAALWDRVTRHNAAVAKPLSGLYRVTFYLGQSVCFEDEQVEP